MLMLMIALLSTCRMSAAHALGTSVGRDGLLKASLKLKSQADGLKAGSCGMLNGTVVGSGCGRVCGDRFPRFCL